MTMHPDLKIKIPRKIDPAATPYWDLVRKHGGSRKSLVDFICGIGGYSDRGFRSAIEFNIKVYGADLTVENLWKLLCSDEIDVGPDSSLPPAHMAIAKSLFWRVHKQYESQLWEWAGEEAYEGWSDSDSPYETWLGERVSWAWQVHGRSGGHLCMTECEGIDLKCSEEDLQERLMCRSSALTKDGWDVPHTDVRALFIICVKNTVELTPKKIDEEVEYRAAWRLWVSFCEDELPELIAQYEKREELSAAAGEILGVLTSYFEMYPHPEGRGVGEVEAFRAICQLADVKIGE